MNPSTEREPSLPAWMCQCAVKFPCRPCYCCGFEHTAMQDACCCTCHASVLESKGCCSCTDLRKLYSLGRKALRMSTWCQALGKALRKLSTMSHKLAWLPACWSPNAPSTKGAKVLR